MPHANHIGHKMVSRSAKEVAKVLGSEKLDLIVIDYNRKAPYYVNNFLIGSAAHTRPSTAGSNLLKFVNALKSEGCLNAGCKLQFARVDEGTRLLAETLQNLRQAFGPYREIAVRVR